MSQTIHTEGVVTLKAIVQSALWQAKRPKSDYRRFFEFAYRGYRELRLHHVQEGTRFAKLTASSINTIGFPEDMVDFVGIGVPFNGKIDWLTRNDDIVITTTLVGAIETQDSVEGEGVDIPVPCIYDLHAKGGVNLDGYYKIDWENRRIFLNSNLRTTFVLAYRSSGTNVTGETYVPVKFDSVLIAWIVWQDARYDTQKLTIAPYYEQQYKNELVMLDEGPTIEEYLDTMYSTYTMLPQR